MALGINGYRLAVVVPVGTHPPRGQDLGGAWPRGNGFLIKSLCSTS